MVESASGDAAMMAKRKWVAGLWLIASLVATAGWWTGLAYTAMWLVERAFS